MCTAVVDIGSNSVRLLIAKTIAGEIKIVETGLDSSRLGEGIGERYLLKTAIQRTVDALIGFNYIIKKHGVEKVIVTATSAVRDASNREDFILEVKRNLGWDVEVLSGIDEAALSYQGAVRGLGGDIKNPVVFDIGGGSTEFIWNKAGCLNYASLQLGAVRMTESQSSLDYIRGVLARTLDDVINAGVGRLIGVGGTITTLAAIDQGLDRYDSDRVHGYCLKRDRVYEILHRLDQMSPEQRRTVSGLQPQRADIIVAGIKIVVSVLEGLDAQEIIASETDIMYGLMYRSSGRV